MAEQEIIKMIKNRYFNNVVSLSIDSNFSNESYIYSLVPVYFVNFKYKNKEYFNLMNGQNGNIGGGLPYSKVKISFIVLLSIILVIGVPLLILLLS